MKKLWLTVCVLALLGLGLPRLLLAAGGYLLMASTIGPVDAGIVAALENAFEKESGIRVRHVGAGTGATLKIAEKGNIDLVMVHARALEEKFVADGYGTERIDLMYNDFVIMGPAADPAGIRGMTSAAEALKRIAAKGASFVSRGDKSGTHVAEMDLWGKAGVAQAGPWYVVYDKGASGNAPTLKYTDEKQAYTLMDRATYLSLQQEIKLAVLVENDEALLNFISLIPVNPAKFPRVNHQEARAFVQWLTDPAKGQAIIADFGKDKYGSPLFFANSQAWRERQGAAR
ncbi:MAG: tungsten ABC transporter permease [Desulfobulbaceae bacterium A2]|nr:MAG: tungsten ABC transporter permease [Desulfobulbaceae bacterium A2]